MKTDLLHLRWLALRSLRLLALLCTVIVCSAAGQDTITGDPPPCTTSDVAVAANDSPNPSADDSLDLDNEEAEALRVRVARLGFPQNFVSSGARLTRPVFLRAIPPEVLL